jgi:hypothetical protein
LIELAVICTYSDIIVWLSTKRVVCSVENVVLLGLEMEELDHFTELLVARDEVEAETEEVLERSGGKTLFALPAEVTIVLGGFAATAVKGDPPLPALKTGVVPEEVETTPGGAAGSPIPGGTAGSAMTVGGDASTAPAQAGSQILV